MKKIKMIKQVTPSLVVVARSDAHSIEGIDYMVDRLNAYVEAGADIVFPEAMKSIEDFEYVREHVNAPILANMTEFGKTDYIHVDDFNKIGINYVLYPVTSLRAAAFNTKKVYEYVRDNGSQQGFLDELQTRKDLYDVLQLDAFEAMDSKIDKTILPTE